MRIILLLSLLSLQAYGCVCAAWPSARDAWAGSQLVFLGVVDRADPPSASIFAQTAWVTVKEAFKGVSAGQQIVLKQAGNDCAPKFNAGSEVLLYLSPLQPGFWIAPACHRSRSLADAADDLLFLRALPKSASANRLSGEVVLYEDSPSLGFHRVHAFSRLRVTIASKNANFDAYTNTDGVYEVYGLPPGTYTVKIDMPPGLKLQFPTITGPRHGLLPRGTTVSLDKETAVSVDFVLYENNRISGVLLTQQGKPVQNSCLDLEPADQQAGQKGRIFDCTKQDGSFTLDDMPSGRYVIVGNKSGQISITEPYPTTYYPGVSTRADAQVLEIIRGQSIEGLQFRLPTMARQIAVSGRVQFSDGVPVPQAYLKHSSNDPTYTHSDSDGRFSVELLADERGELSAEIMAAGSELEKCPEWKPKGDSRMLVTLTSSSVPISGDQGDVLLIMPVRSCPAWVPVGLR
jgi:hypothetical protein